MKLPIYLLSLFLLGFVLQIQAQTQVYNLPLDSIQLMIEENPEYLGEINKQFITPHSKPELTDYFDIYYGSAYLDSYSPYGERLVSTLLRDLIKEGDYKEVIDACNEQILNHPGFIRPFYYLGIAYENLGDTTSAAIFYERFYNFLSLPYYSGTGESFDSAYVVRSIDDEYLILGELNLDMQSQALVYNNDIPYDILYATSPNDTTLKKIHFNIEQPFLRGFSFLNDDVKKKSDVGDKPKKKKKKKKD